MAKLNKKKADTTPIVEETKVVEESTMTQEEKEVIQKDEEKRTQESADTRRLQLATNVVSSQFNLDPSYDVKKFDDKGKVVNLTLENKDFIVNVTIKDSERHGMHVE